MPTIKEWYRRANALLPPDIPPPTAKEAVNAARRLYRWGMGHKFPGKVKVTSGRRYTWVHRGVLKVNPDRKPASDGGGWYSLIHDLSHYLWRAANGWSVRPHEKGHAKLEYRMIKEAIKRGWVPAAAPVVAPAPSSPKMKILF